MTPKLMETIIIDILNPKAKSILKSLADLKLINIRKEKNMSEIYRLLEKLRNQTDQPPSPEEIQNEVEAVRKSRY